MKDERRGGVGHQCADVSLEHASRDRADLVEEIAHVIAHGFGHPELETA